MRFLVGWCALAFVMVSGPTGEAQSAYSASPNASASAISGDTTRIVTRHHSWQAILQIFARAQSAIKIRNLPLAKSIQLTHSSHASAFVYRRENIQISEALIETLRSKDELAFAISHEMAHIALRHTADSTTLEELSADAFAASLLIEMGMDSCASATALEALQRREPNYREPLGERIQHLNKLLFADCPVNNSALLALRESPMAQPFNEAVVSARYKPTGTGINRF